MRGHKNVKYDFFVYLFCCYINCTAGLGQPMSIDCGTNYYCYNYEMSDD
jgi:hypothetical protein